MQPFLKDYPPSRRILLDMALKRLRELSMMVTYKKNIIRRFKRLIKLSEILSSFLKKRKLKEIPKLKG